MRTISLAIIALFASDASAIMYRPKAEQAPWYKTHTGPTWMDPTWPVNYVVPNFGKDHEIISTEKTIAETEKTMGK